MLPAWKLNPETSTITVSTDRDEEHFDYAHIDRITVQLKDPEVEL